MLQKLLTWLGFGLCHQLPERSYILGGLQAPVCVRDTGIYIGFVVAFALLLLIDGRRPRGLPKAHVWVTMGLLLLFMAWDGITSYAGMRTTINGLRLITGLGVGFSAAALVFPMLNDELWRDSGGSRVLDPYWRYIVWVVGIPVTWAVVTYAAPSLGLAFIVSVALSIPVTLTLINMVIVCMLPRFDRRGTKFTDAIVPAIVAFAMAVAEISAAAGLRMLLLGLPA